MCLQTLTKESLAVIGARPGELASLVINLGTHVQRVTVILVCKCVSSSSLCIILSVCYHVLCHQTQEDRPLVCSSY